MRLFVRFKLAVAILLTFPALVGCVKSETTEKKKTFSTTLDLKSQEGEPIAKIGNMVLTVEGLARRYSRQFGATMVNDKSRQAQILEAEIRQELLAQEAVRRGYLNDPKVQTAVKKILVRKMSEEAMAMGPGTDKFAMSDIRAYFNDHKSDFVRPRKVRASYVFVPFGRDRKASYKKIADVQKMAKSPKYAQNPSFLDLAMKFSSPARGIRSDKPPFDLGYVTDAELKQQLGEDVAKTIFNIKGIGEISPIVKAKKGFFIFKKTGERKGLDRKLADSETLIRKRLYYDKRREAFTNFIDDLRKNIGVEVYTERFSKLNNMLKSRVVESN